MKKLTFIKTRIKKSKIEELLVFTISEWNANEKIIVKEISNNFKNKKIIIRSSAKGEDSIKKSEAGKGDAPRIGISQDEWEKKWESIFGKKEESVRPRKSNNGSSKS